MNLRGLLHLFVVYIVWGSTYLAIRVAVREGAGFPPFMMAATRVLAASGILLLWGVMTRGRFRLSRKEISFLAISAILLWVGGNGMVAWAERKVDSGYAALLVGSMPIWVAIMEAIIDRQRPSLRLVGALLVGLSGVAVLNGPVIAQRSIGDLFGALALIFAALSWGLGSLVQRRRPVSIGPEISSGYQQAIGCVGLLVVSLLVDEPGPSPTPQAWTAWGYLVLFGSVFAFTSFVKALRLLPTNIVMTYAYVNPVIAVFLGRIILHEPVTWWTISGTTLVVLGVMGVFHEKRRENASKKAKPRIDDQDVE
ncbi:MAG: EamA family transporter [Candidatus Krumholzibacteria bacterium]|nr:EamA family transporter [Candidatus Krumholzibacteria bacterium]